MISSMLAETLLPAAGPTSEPFSLFVVMSLNIAMGLVIVFRHRSTLLSRLDEKPGNPPE